jgi:type IV fimbrial biogenesis protein FimT
MATKHISKAPRAGGQRGITLLEACVVIAVTAIVAATALPSFSDLIDTHRLAGAATRLAADIQFARSEALARNRPLRLSVHAGADASCWVVHTGGAAECSCAHGASVVCSGAAVEIKSVVLPAAERVGVVANVASIAFDPLHGTSTPTGTLRLIDAHGRAIHHVVNVVGRVRSCAQGAAIAGYPAC